MHVAWLHACMHESGLDGKYTPTKGIDDDFTPSNDFKGIDNDFPPSDDFRGTNNYD